MLTATATARRQRRANAINRTVKRVEDVVRLAEITVNPLLDLAIRLWLAQIFWVSGILKLANWDNAITLATYEYPVSWLDPVTAATLGAATEILCPILLALGLATRLAAIPLLILSLVIQFEYRQLNEHLYWAALFGWYVVMGAGPISMDRLLAPGLNASALPLVRPLSRLYAGLTRYFGPIYQLFIRVWLATLLFAPILAGRWLLDWILGFASPFLALGLATRLVALLAVLGLLGMGLMGMDELQGVDRLYWSFFLGLLVLRGPGPISLDRLLQQQLGRLFPGPAWSGRRIPSGRSRTGAGSADPVRAAAVARFSRKAGDRFRAFPARTGCGGADRQSGGAGGRRGR